MTRAGGWMGRVRDEVRKVAWAMRGTMVWEDHVGWAFRLRVDFGFHSEGEGAWEASEQGHVI